MIRNLTEGNVRKTLWLYSIPMLISVMFQQIYNIADSMIAGKFAGEDALAAVGASYPITMLFIAIAVGSSVGSSVVISQLFGAKNYKSMKTAISTCLVSIVCLSFILMILGFVFCNPLMNIINTPKNIFKNAALYMQIYIGGILFLFLYNICTGIFNALGDSKTPLYLLITSSVGNIVLDYIFVAYFKWQVAGVAWATFIAQGFSCIFAFLILLKRINNFHSEIKAPLFSGEMLKKVSYMSIPSILQQSFVSVGNIFVQSLINSFGSEVIAGYSAAMKLNTLVVTSFSTLGNGLSGFTAQNIGANKPKRIKEGYFCGCQLAFIVTVIFFVCYFIFPRQLLLLFMNSDSHRALEVGSDFLKIVSPFYIFVGVKLISDGALRGSGAMKTFMIATFTDLILRVALSYILAVPFGINGVWISWPVGWIVATALSVVFYINLYYRKKEART